MIIFSVISLPHTSGSVKHKEYKSLALHSSSKILLPSGERFFKSAERVIIGSDEFFFASFKSFAPFSLKPKTLIYGTGVSAISLVTSKYAQRRIRLILDKV